MINFNDMTYKPIVWDALFLTTAARPAPFEDRGFLDSIRIELQRYIDEYKIQAISAPQIGFHYNMFLFKDLAGNVQDIYNARIVDFSGNEIKFKEGAINYPGVDIRVTRKDKIRARFQNREGGVFTKTYEGLDSRLFQMMHDTVSGVLITSRVNFAEKDRFRRKMLQFSRQK